MKKKLIRVLMAVGMLLALPVIAGAEDTAATPAIRFETVEVDETAGSVVEIEVYIENNPGFVSATIPVTWDGTVLKLTNIKDYDTTITSGWIGYTDYDQITDTYYLAWNNDTLHDGSYGEINFTEDGKLCTMVFEVLDPAEAGTTYEISVDLTDPLANIMNWNMEDFLNPNESDGIYGVTIEFIDGGITIKESVIPGDVNGDGEVTVKDRLYLERFIASWDGYTLETINADAADLNGDGEVTAKDRLILARYFAGWEGYEDLSSFRG